MGSSPGTDSVELRTGEPDLEKKVAPKVLRSSILQDSVALNPHWERETLSSLLPLPLPSKSKRI